MGKNLSDREYFELLRNQLTQSYLEAVESGHEKITFYRDTFDKLALVSNRNAVYDDFLNGKVKKFAIVPKTSDELFDAISVMELALKSKWASLKERKIIYEKSKRTLMDVRALNEDAYLRFIDVMQNRVFPAIQGNFIPPSELVLYVQGMCISLGYNNEIEEAVYAYVAERYGPNRDDDKEHISEMIGYASDFFAKLAK